MNTRRVFVYVAIVLMVALSVGNAYAAGPGPRQPASPIESAPGPVTPLACTQLLQDPGFEAGTPSPYWGEYDLQFGSPLCDINVCPSTNYAHTGDWWVWFGGLDTPNSAYVSQTVTIPTGVAVVTFWLRISTSTPDPTDFLSVRMDGTEVASILGDATGYTDYALVTVPINTYANGAAHTLQLYSDTAQAGTHVSFFVDDVNLCATNPTSVSLVALDAAAAPAPVWPFAVAGVVAFGAVFGAYRLVRRTR